VSAESSAEIIRRLGARQCESHDYRYQYGVGQYIDRNGRLEAVRYDRYHCTRCLDIQDRETPLLFGLMGIFEGDKPL
jgi:hypothetical protein